MIGVINGLLTLFLIIVFLGIVFWAYSKHNKKTFEAMANLPLEENASTAKEANRE